MCVSHQYNQVFTCLDRYSGRIVQLAVRVGLVGFRLDIRIGVCLELADTEFCGILAFNHIVGYIFKERVFALRYVIFRNTGFQFTATCICEESRIIKVHGILCKELHLGA